MGERLHKQTVVIADLGRPIGILGLDFLDGHRSVVQFGDRIISIGSVALRMRKLGDTNQLDEHACNIVVESTVIVGEGATTIDARIDKNVDVFKELKRDGYGMIQVNGSFAEKSGRNVPFQLTNVDSDAIQCTVVNSTGALVTLKRV